MSAADREAIRHADPELSLIMPCYNEAASLTRTIAELTGAFGRAGHRLQLVAVDNGSTDETAAAIESLAVAEPVVELVRVDRNQGYGHGILTGLSRCRAAWVGIIHADGQVDAADVVRLYEEAAGAHQPVLAKVRRRFRMDGLWRKFVSTSYNVFIRLLWPRLGSIDVNGTPKLLPRDAALAMNLQSRGWMLDPEIMVKSHYLGLRVLEFNVLARVRSAGLSHVRVATCWEFLRDLIAVRATGRWRRELGAWPAVAEPVSPRTSGEPRPPHGSTSVSN